MLLRQQDAAGLVTFDNTVRQIVPPRTQQNHIDALCNAIGREGEVVSGAHSWLLADPDAFGEVMTNILDVARMAQQLESEEAEHRVPTGLARRLLGGLGRRG